MKSITYIFVILVCTMTSCKETNSSAEIKTTTDSTYFDYSGEDDQFTGGVKVPFKIIFGMF